MHHNIFTKNKISAILLAGTLSVSSIGASASNVEQIGKDPKNKAAQRLGLTNHLNAGFTAKNMAALISLPGKSMNYDFSNGAWQHIDNTTYTYNTIGNLTEEVIKDLNNVNLQRHTTDYDAQGREIQSDYFTWSNGQWVKNWGYKTLVTYNSNNKPTEEIYQTWEPASTTYANNDKQTYVYNPVGDLIETTYSSWYNGAWEPMGRNTYNYLTPGGPFNELAIMEWDNGAWVNMAKYSDIVWFNFTKEQVASFNVSYWNGTSWSLAERYSATYDQFGGSVEIAQDYVNGTWVNSERYTIVYDVNYNLTEYKSEDWDNNTWLVDYHQKNLLTYNANMDITERIIQYTTSSTGVLENQRKEVYSDFVYVVSGTASTVADLNLSVFPNPVQNTLTVSGDISQPVTIRITDLTGRTVHTQVMQASASNVNLSLLNAGTYLVNLSSDKGQKTAKIIKL